jgi:hypothetical protein
MYVYTYDLNLFCYGEVKPQHKEAGQ